MDQNDNLLKILSILYKWRKQLIYTCLAALVLSVICSLTLDNYYKSHTIFYSASPDLAKPVPIGASELDQDFYGQDTDLDRLFSIARSSDVVDYIIEKYDLYKHYDINPASKRGPYNIKKKFGKMYTALKTKYGALQLSVEDKDPKLAAQMANDVRNKVNEIAQNLIKDSQKKLLEVYKSNIKNKEATALMLNDSLFNLRNKYNIYHTRSQGQVFAEMLAKVEASLNDKEARISVYKSINSLRDSVPVLKAVIAGLKEQKTNLENQADLFNQGLAIVVSLESEQRDFVYQLNLDKERFKQLQVAYTNPFSAMHVVETADVPIIKSRPHRSIIVLASVFATFCISCLVVLLLESYKRINWSRIKGDA